MPMLAAIAMMAMGPTNPPVAHARSFICTPVALDIRTGEVECDEGFGLKLWGIRLSSEALTEIRATAELPSFVKAQGAHANGGHKIGFDHALPMRCYADHQQAALRTAQCFVRSELIFGDEDLARLLVRRGFATGIVA